MKKRKNKTSKYKKIKAFSMVELLGTIVVLGIIMAIAIPSVSSVIEKSKRNYYDTELNTIIMAAQAYANDDRSVLPKEIGGIKKITAEELKEKDYLDSDIKDSKGNVCNMKNSYVNILKDSKRDYKYSAVLNCKECEDGECLEEGKYPPVISITMADNSGNNIKNDSNDYSAKYIIKPSTEVNDNSTVKSYSYKVYQDGIQKYYSGIKVNRKDGNIESDIKIFEYLPGKIKVTVTATNSYGLTATKSITKEYKDVSSAECGQVLYEGNTLDNSNKTCTGTNKWIGTNSNPSTRNVWVTCDDKLGVGCGRPMYSKTFENEENDKDSVIIYDANNNATRCNVMICIDKTAPSATINIYKADSSGNKTGSAVDTFTVDKAKGNIEKALSSKWFNETYKNNGIYIEVTAKDDPAATGKSTSKVNRIDWLLNGTAVTTKNTSSSGTGMTTGYTLTLDGQNKNEITIYDNANNYTKIVLTTNSDYIPPKCNPSGGSTTWSNNQTITGTCEDNESGCKSNATKTIKTTTVGKVSPGEVVDNAGNKTLCGSVDVKVDGEPPTCKSTGGTTTWKTSQTIKGTCSDTGGSGCVSNVSQSISSNKNTTVSPGTVKDNAGNTTACDKVQVKVDACTAYASSWTCGSYSSWSSCSGSTRTRTRTCTKKSTFGSNYVCKSKTETDTDSSGCFGKNNCNIRGSRKRTAPSSWHCTCGSNHTQYYQHYCSDSNGNVKKATNYSYVCPVRPYGPNEGWKIYND